MSQVSITIPISLSKDSEVCPVTSTSKQTEDPPIVNTIWGGRFSFQNQLGDDIVNGYARHWTTDWGKEEIPLDGLGNGQTTIEKAFTTSTTNKYRWSFDATLKNGERYTVGEKDCGYESTDSGKTVHLQAINKNGYHSFYISMPDSSDCSTSF